MNVLYYLKKPIYADFPMNGEIERPLGIICQGTMNTNLNIHFVNKAVMSEWMVYICYLLQQSMKAKATKNCVL